MLCLGLATSANAERRMFIVANDADGYGIDRCLAFGEKCGPPPQRLLQDAGFCGSFDLPQGQSQRHYRRPDASDAQGCRNNTRNVVAIVCTR
jgi:hypothetical protein